MSKQFSRKRAASEEYEADGGFVEDAPKSKKTKATNVKDTKPKSSPKSKESESQYWEVRRLRSINTHYETDSILAWPHPSRPAQRVQGQAASRHSRVLREG